MTSARPIYRGFSTNQPPFARDFKLTNADVIKQDLLNHVNTLRGERVMNPNFGTRIPLMAFEPLDDVSLKIIEEDLREVIAAEPRVELLGLSVLPLSENNVILAVVELRYRELGATETITLDFPVNG